MESNFYPENDSPRFNDLRARTPYRAIQIVCTAPGDMLLQRFEQRETSGQRHPGHGGPESIEEFRELLLAGGSHPLAIDGPLIEVDTTTPDGLQYEQLIAQIRRWMHGGQQETRP